MKFVPLVLCVLSVAGLPSLRAEPPKKVSPTETASVTIPVKGMSCMACVAKTKRALAAVPGVAAVEVKLSPGSATVQYDRAQVSPEKLADVITGLGYQAGAPMPKAAQ